MVGSDVATTWMSRIAMNMPRHIRLKPNQVATVALVVRQVIAGRASSSEAAGQESYSAYSGTAKYAALEF